MWLRLAVCLLALWHIQSIHVAAELEVLTPGGKALPTGARRLRQVAPATAAAPAPGPVCTPEQDSSPALRAAREQAIAVWAPAAVSVGQYKGNISLQQGVLADITTPEVTLDVLGAGVFPGRSETAEYTLLAVPSVNGELLWVDSRTIRQNCTWVTPNICNISYVDVLGIKGQAEPVVGETDEQIRFQPCTALIQYVSSVFPKGAMPLILAAAADTGSAEAICNAAVVVCPGELMPFPSVLDCVTFMRQLPAACDDGVHTLQGNTTACRQLHVSAAMLDPLVHCPHVAPNSPKCVQADCPADKYTAPAQAPSKEDEIAEASDTARWAVAAVLLAACLAGVAVGALLMARASRLTRVLDAPVQELNTSFTKQPPTDRLKHLAHLMGRSRSRMGQEGLSVAFSNLQLAIGGRTLLDGAWGHFKGGHLIAVMGPSGAGKSTLLKLLMGRSQGGGAFTGAREWYSGGGGQRADIAAVQQSVAFLEQDDSVVAGVFPLLSVSESLMYHASLVLPASLSMEQRAAKVEGVLDETLLGPASGTQIRSLSGGQTRRWALACQLLRDPAAILLDEPTSGLDATMALSVMRVLHQQANAGRMVALTIHQPRAAIFGLFDDILVLAGQGSTAYFGPPADLVATLEMRHRLLQDAAAYAASAQAQGVISPAVARQLACAYSDVDRNSDGQVCSADIDAFLQDNPDSLLDAETRSDTRDIAGFSSLQQARDRGRALDCLAGVVLKVGTAPLQRLEDLLAFMPQETGGKVLSTRQRMWLQLLGTAILQDVGEAVAGSNEAADAPAFFESPGELVSDFFASKGAAALASNQRLQELNVGAAAELAGRLDALQGGGPALGVTTKARRQQRRPGLARCLEVRLLRSWRDRMWSTKLGFQIGALATAALSLLMFPQLTTDGIGDDYLYAACLLMALAAMTNTGFFNKSAPIVGQRTRAWRLEFEDRTAGVTETWAFFYLRDCLADTLGTTLLFLPLYFGVGYSRGSAVGGLEAYVALLLFTGALRAAVHASIVSSAGNLFYLLFQPTAAVLCCGLWLAWNTLFAGVLIKVWDLFIIWRPWAAYSAPFYHAINVWILATFADTRTDCKPKDILQLCPPTGAYVLDSMQYGDVPSTASLAVLAGYYVLQWGLVAAVLRWKYASPSPAKHLGPTPPAGVAGEAGGSGGKASPGLGSPQRSGDSGSSPKGYAPLRAAEEGAA